MNNLNNLLERHIPPGLYPVRGKEPEKLNMTV